MASLILLRYRQRRLLRRNRIFRDRTNPLHKCNDLELFWQFRFRRAGILQMTNELKEELEHLNRKGALPPVFTGRRTALNPCQQLTSTARQTVCPGRLQFPIFLFCFFLFFVLFCCCFLFLFSSLKKSFFMSLSFSRTWSGVRTHTPRLLPFLAISCHNWPFCWLVTSLFKVL